MSAIDTRPSVEDFVTDISRRMIGVPPAEIDAAIDAALRAVGAFTGCDRVYLFAVDGDVLRNTHEWSAPGVPPAIHRLQAVPASGLPWMLSRLRRGEFVHVDRVDDVDGMPPGERAHLRAQDIGGVALAPIHPGGHLVGFLGVDAVGRQAGWSRPVVTVLRWLADVIGGVLARRESHEALERSEARYRAIVEQQTELVCRYRPDTTLTFVNAAYAASYGSSPHELVGRSLLSLLPPGEHRWTVAHIASLGAGKAVETHEHPVTLPDGTVRWYQWTDHAVLGPGGEVVEIQAVGREVTARREAETALRKSEERFRGAFEDAPIGMAIATFGGRFLRVNRALCELFGYTDEELLARTVAAVIPPGDEIHAARLEQLASGEATRVRFESRYVRADGGDVWALVTLSLIRDPSGEPEHILGQVVDITDRKAAEDRLAEQVLHDPLTGLPNRVLLLDRLNQALARRQRTGKSVAALFCNIDHFKVVNDSLGHAGGDEMLVEVARRLQSETRAAETVARVGADEFVLVTEGIDRQEDALGFARRLGRALEAPVHVGGVEVVTSMSIGIAFAAPTAVGDAVAPEAVLRDASAAMSRAKHLGSGRVAVCDDATRATVTGRLELLNALRGAAARGELRLEYQPIFPTGGREPSGVEALVRWEHPERGLLAPSAFLPLAEETGLVARIGEWVLGEACRQAARWRGSDESPFQVWVNLSAAELAHPDLAERVAAALRASGADPRQLCLELSERAVMEDPGQTVATLTSLRELGVRVAIDDFGTGYSSMASLRQFPLDALKIDRSFVTGLGTCVDDTAIAKAIIDLAHGLGLEVVAEGVENGHQLSELRSLRCDLVQGFLLAHPQPAEALEPNLALVAG